VLRADGGGINMGKYVCAMWSEIGRAIEGLKGSNISVTYNDERHYCRGFQLSAIFRAHLRGKRERRTRHQDGHVCRRSCRLLLLRRFSEPRLEREDERDPSNHPMHAAYSCQIP
jgi:hypothetical protein